MTSKPGYPDWQSASSLEKEFLPRIMRLFEKSYYKTMLLLLHKVKIIIKCQKFIDLCFSDWSIKATFCNLFCFFLLQGLHIFRMFEGDYYYKSSCFYNFAHVLKGGFVFISYLFTLGLTLRIGHKDLWHANKRMFALF